MSYIIYVDNIRENNTTRDLLVYSENAFNTNNKIHFVSEMYVCFI